MAHLFSGVEIHATMVDNIIAGDALSIPNWMDGAQFLAILLVALGMTLLVSRGCSWLSFLLTLCTLGLSMLCISAIPELNDKTHLPVVADPSHGTGHAHLVPATSLAAVAAGADALLLECHLDPEHAMSDGAQSITPDALKELMKRIKKVAQAIDRDI